jgi:hypothetical protein
MFSLVVDDFVIQYTHLPDAQHLLAALKQHYEAITVDWTGSLFCGISLQWNYTNRMVDLSIPHYVQDAFVKPTPGQKQTRPNAELESQAGQRETQAGALSQREERLDTNGVNNGEASFRIRAYAHS